MRWVVRILLWIGLGFLGLLVVGAVYQQVGLSLDSDLAPPPRDVAHVDGRAVHLACSGNGPRSILLDAGAGAGVFEWYRLQPLLAKAARVCAFDRAGLGWSDSASGGYDALAAADQLSGLVKAAHISTPFVYVGHSLGADFGIVYAARHPRDVAALVLIEPGVPTDLLEDTHATRAEAMAAADCGVSCYAAGVATFFGVVRVATSLIGHKTFDAEHRRYYQAYLARPTTALTTLASLSAVPKTAYEVEDVKSFGAIPVLTVASANPLPDNAGFASMDEYRKWRPAQHRYFASLAEKSTHGAKPIVVPNSDHSTMVLGQTQAAFLAAKIAAFLAANGR